MHTPDALIDIHDCTHRSLEKLLVHCRQLSDQELNRPLSGFGYATIRLQAHHVIGAERYWIGVLQGRVEVEEDVSRFPSVASLEAFRRSVAEITRAFLRGTTERELNAEREMTAWGGLRRTLMPARVVLRTQTHIFHHLGQIAAMCRLLGRASAGADYPLD